MKGKLIVIEGSDGSGKTVQSKLLARRLEKLGKKVFVIDFPQYYKTLFGKLIGFYLSGKFNLTPYEASMLYALDRLEAKPKIEEMLNKEYIVIANRYIASNLAHQAARMPRKYHNKFINWLIDVEFRKHKMPRPYFTFYLYVPVSVSQKLILKKSKRKYTEGKKKDIHERNVNYLLKVVAVYKVLSKRKDWLLINCVKNNEIMGKKDIHELIWKKVSSKV